MNSIIASTSFDYQGKHYTLECKIDVDNLINNEDFFNSVYLLLARSGDIGLYSYQLEILQDQDIIFSNPQGYARNCVNNGSLDLELLREKQKIDSCKPAARKIYKKYFPESEIDKNIVNALVEAYLLGKSSYTKFKK